MLKRVLVGVIGVPLLILVLSFAPAWATMLLLCALCAVGAYELMRAVAGERGRRLTVPTVLVAGLVPATVYWQKDEALPSLSGRFSADLQFLPQDTKELSARPSFLPLLALVFVFALFLYLILHYGRDTALPFSDLTAAVFAGLVFPLMLSCLLRLRLLPGGEALVWMPLAISFGSDTFALFAGMGFGRHKMAPLVSPHKTVEGGVGGLLGGIIGLLLLKGLAVLMSGMPLLSYGQVALFGVLGGIVGELGDLSFSVIKREYGVKDYGKLLPGHGGVLDRFDSVTFVAPLVWLLFYFE